MMAKTKRWPKIWKFEPMTPERDAEICKLLMQDAGISLQAPKLQPSDLKGDFSRDRKM
jgi:hypothetical protein